MVAIKIVAANIGSFSIIASNRGKEKAGNNKNYTKTNKISTSVLTKEGTFATGY